MQTICEIEMGKNNGSNIATANARYPDPSDCLFHGSIMTPKQRAEQSATAMMAGDQASKWLGISLVNVDEGHATMELKVQPHHTNGHGVCHGGIIFSLADSTFAFACNSRNQNTLAQHCVVTFISPAKEDDHLTATATELSTTGRSGIYDVRVTDQNARTVAEFRGFSRSIKGRLFPEDKN